MARSSCAKLSARSRVNSRPCVRFKIDSLLAASAVISKRRFLRSSFSRLSSSMSMTQNPCGALARTRRRSHVQVRPAAIHDGAEFGPIPRLHGGDETLDRQLQCQQRFAAVLIQALDLEI